MKIKVISICLLFCVTGILHAQIPKQGVDTLLDIATWNIEWFGDTQNGPTNEALQYNNVKEVITRADIDIWSLCEVSDLTTFQNLIHDLGNYSYALATYSQTQKTALIWKTNMFDLLLNRHVLTDAAYDYDFAGRPPLEVMLRRKDSLYQDTILFYVLHLKAYGDQTSYGRRKNAAGYLKTFLDANRTGMKFYVQGDWNDKIQGSIYNGTTESPFLNFINDSNRYTFASKQLAEEGRNSYYTGSLIDHIMYGKACDSFYVKGNAKVLDFLPNYISGYTSNTSDHYPEVTYTNFKRYLPEPVHTGFAATKNNLISIYPVPTNEWIHLPDEFENAAVSIRDAAGHEVVFRTGKNIQVQSLKPGYYTGLVTQPTGETGNFRFVKTE